MGAVLEVTMRFFAKLPYLFIDCAIDCESKKLSSAEIAGLILVATILVYLCYRFYTGFYEK